MIYLVHADYKNYNSFVFNAKSVRKALGCDTQFHFSRSPQSYIDSWQSFEIDFESLGSKKAKMPEITVRNGKMFLSEHATAVLKNIIENQGEFLPITYQNHKGIIFNILTTAEDVDGLKDRLSSKNVFGEVQSLAFNEDLVKSLHIFRTIYDGYMGIYCSEVFKNTVEQSGLKGVKFSSDIGAVFPLDKQEKSPCLN